MAEWRGMKVKLNSPTAIRKGEPGYGRKAKKVFVMSNGKVKKVMFGDPNMANRKNNPKARASFRARHKCSTAKDKTLLVTGRVGIGKGEICQKVKTVILLSRKNLQD